MQSEEAKRHSEEVNGWHCLFRKLRWDRKLFTEKKWCRMFYEIFTVLENMFAFKTKWTLILLFIKQLLLPLRDECGSDLHKDAHTCHRFWNNSKCVLGLSAFWAFSNTAWTTKLPITHNAHQLNLTNSMNPTADNLVGTSAVNNKWDLYTYKRPIICHLRLKMPLFVPAYWCQKVRYESLLTYWFNKD